MNIRARHFDELHELELKFKARELDLMVQLQMLHDNAVNKHVPDDLV